MRTYGNGGQRRDYVDRDGRLYSIVSNLNQGFRYGFDANGRLTQLTNFAEPASGLWSQTYGYDALNRLTSATSAGLGHQRFQYDPNRTRLTRGGSVSDYTIATTSNRLTAITGPGARSYTYTATGQVSTITGAMGGHWIFRNGFQHGPAQTTTFSYDTLNRDAIFLRSSFGLISGRTPSTASGHVRPCIAAWVALGGSTAAGDTVDLDEQVGATDVAVQA